MNFLIHRKVLLFMLFTGLSLLGYISYQHLATELMPTPDFPTLIVQVGSQQSMDPHYIEQQAVIPLEGVIGQLEGVKAIESIALQQSGRIQVSYQKGTNMKFAYLKLLEKVEEKAKSLPQGFRVDVSKSDPEAINYMFMTLQVRGSGGVDRVRKIVDNDITDRLQNIEGIALAEAFGGRRSVVQVILNEEACKAHQLSPSHIQQAINRNNQPREFAGTVNHQNQGHTVTVKSEYHEPEEIKELIVKDKGTVRLKDVASVSFGVEEETSYSRVNGKETVTIRLIKDSESNLINLSADVLEQIEKINQELGPSDIEVVVEYNAADIMKENIDLIINLAFSGGILAIIVLWVFLRNFRLVATVALAIPVSVFAAFNFFYANDISINTITLLGIALAVGMLLDNSIVVMENIYRLAAKDGDIDKAAIQGTREVWRSIFAATLTTIVIFLPFAFSESMEISIIGKNIGVSVVSTLLISLLVSLLFIPMVTHLLLKKKQDRKFKSLKRLPFHSRFVQIYLVFLKNCMRRPAPVILGALLLFFMVLSFSMLIGSNYYQEPEVKELTLYVNMHEGATLERTDKVVSEVEDRLSDLKGKKDLMSQVYEKEAVVKISLVDNYNEIQELSLPELKLHIWRQVQGIQFAQFTWHPPYNGKRFRNSGGGVASAANFGSLLGNRASGEKIIIKGQDFARMYSLAFDLKYHLEQDGAMEGVHVGIPQNSPELQLGFDQYLMGMYDISPQSVLTELRSFPSEFSSGATLKQGNEEYNIIIKTKPKTEDERLKERSLEDLKGLKVQNRAKTAFELNKIASFNFAEGLTSINRVNQARQVEIYYQFLPVIQKDSELLAVSQLAVDETVENIHLPPGIAIEVIHDDRDLSDVPFLLFSAFLLIYMILAAVFESFATPLVLMFSIPLAAIGSLLALILTGNPLLNHITLIGFMILLGIVVNNSIILIDYTRVLKRRGISSQRALMTAGLARLRPILVTAITTIVALIPMALGKSEYISMSGVPFAITVIGGLFTSTLLTLVFIPTFNSALTESLKWINSRSAVVKICMLTLCLTGFYLIYTEEESMIWQMIELILLVVLVPGCTYFVQNSLRKANEKLIHPDEGVVIQIRNLVKIYDRESRFSRDWNSGKKIRQRLGISGGTGSLKSLDPLIWQVPVVLFFYYFTFFFIKSGFYEFLFPVFLYIITLNTFKPAKDYFSGTNRKWVQRGFSFLYQTYYWGFPLLSLFLFNNQHELPGLVIPTGILWYFLILVKLTADKLYREKVNIARVKGPFKGIKKAFYRFVLVIPFVGRRKKPFKALKGVSLEIKTGMFGLLGPNGAGKSTLIRIICGLLEPSYGQISINGIDIKEKREELQGLIGYLPQEFGMYENMTAWDFLDYLAILKKLSNKKEREERVAYVLRAVHMYDNRHEKIGSFSGGMRQRIGIAQILLHLPRILVVDEPTAGLDPRERIRFRNLLVELSKERVVIFSTHIIEDVASSCSKLAVIKEGEVKYSGTPVQMAQTANGKVWVAEMSLPEFEIFKEKYVIIHHIRHGEVIKVRFLSEKLPVEEALMVDANLEDAYLYLLNQLKVKKEVEPLPAPENDQEIEPLEVG